MALKGTYADARTIAHFQDTGRFRTGFPARCPQQSLTFATV